MGDKRKCDWRTEFKYTWITCVVVSFIAKTQGHTEQNLQFKIIAS